jgi:hypothetical protein
LAGVQSRAPPLREEKETIAEVESAHMMSQLQLHSALALCQPADPIGGHDLHTWLGLAKRARPVRGLGGMGRHRHLREVPSGPRKLATYDRGVLPPATTMLAQSQKRLIWSG